MSYEIVFYDPHMKELGRAAIDDPKPTGRQLLALAGFRDPREHRVMVLQSDHQLEDIDLEETVDVSESGKAQFILFANSDRSFNFYPGYAAPAVGRQGYFGNNAARSGRCKRRFSVFGRKGALRERKTSCWSEGKS